MQNINRAYATLSNTKLMYLINLSSVFDVSVFVIYIDINSTIFFLKHVNQYDTKNVALNRQPRQNVFRTINDLSVITVTFKFPGRKMSKKKKRENKNHKARVHKNNGYSTVIIIPTNKSTWCMAALSPIKTFLSSKSVKRDPNNRANPVCHAIE